MTKEQFYEREKAKKRNNKLYNQLTGYFDKFNNEIHFGDVVGIEFLHPNPNMYCDVEEVFTVTEETVNWLKTATKITILSKVE